MTNKPDRRGDLVDKLLKCAVVLFVVTMLPLTVFAHPGKTDSSGGHVDHFTGEYHFHHGYPAHDHYDMDGDGSIDCPYNFNSRAQENKTHISYSQNETQESLTIQESVHKTNPAQAYITESTFVNSSEAETNKPSSKVGLLLFSVLVVILGILIAVLDSEKKSNQENQKKFRQEIDRLEADYKSKMEYLVNEQSKRILHNEEIKKDYEKRILALYQQKNNLESKCAEYKKELNTNKSIFSRNRLERKLFLQCINENDGYLVTEKEKVFFEFIRIADTIPDDVYFIKGTIPVSGKVDNWNPFGDFTVFASVLITILVYTYMMPLPPKKHAKSVCQIR